MKINYSSLLLILCLAALPLSAQTSTSKKNVILFLIDDLRPMLGVYGNSWGFGFIARTTGLLCSVYVIDGEGHTDIPQSELASVGS